MKWATIKDATQGGKVVAKMPLFVWDLTGWLSRRPKPWSLLDGFILMAYKWDYQSGRSWWASLISGVRLWWSCRREWHYA